MFNFQVLNPVTELRSWKTETTLKITPAGSFAKGNVKINLLSLKTKMQSKRMTKEGCARARE